MCAISLCLGAVIVGDLGRSRTLTQNIFFPFWLGCCLLPQADFAQTIFTRRNSSEQSHRLDLPSHPRHKRICRTGAQMNFCLGPLASLPEPSLSSKTIRILRPHINLCFGKLSQILIRLCVCVSDDVIMASCVVWMGFWYKKIFLLGLEHAALELWGNFDY